MSLSGFEPRDLPTGEMFWRFQRRYQLRHPAPSIYFLKTYLLDFGFETCMILDYFFQLWRPGWMPLRIVWRSWRQDMQVNMNIFVLNCNVHSTLLKTSYCTLLQHYLYGCLFTVKVFVVWSNIIQGCFFLVPVLKQVTCPLTLSLFHSSIQECYWDSGREAEERQCW